MRILLQRVTGASVTVDDVVVGKIERGLTLLVGITGQDSDDDLVALASKVVNLRIFEADAGKMNLSALDLLQSGTPMGMLVVSQFTLYGDVRKGRRPSFTDAARPEQAAPMIERFAGLLCDMGFQVAQGTFGAHMMVSLTNDGPVTIWIDSDDLRQPRRGEAVPVT